MSIRKMIAKMRCRVGWHDWRYATFRFLIYWRECRHCGYEETRKHKESTWRVWTETENDHE